jgi:inner membrane protein
MHARTHLLIAMFFGYFYLRLFPDMLIVEKFIFSIFIITTSLLPDIDSPTSTLGRKHRFIANITTHRGIFHSIWIPLVAVTLAFVYPVLKGPLMGTFIGYTAHLFADMLTVEGIKPFYPLSKEKVQGPLKTGSILETFIGAAVVMFFLVQPF